MVSVGGQQQQLSTLLRKIVSTTARKAEQYSALTTTTTRNRRTQRLTAVAETSLQHRSLATKTFPLKKNKKKGIPPMGRRSVSPTTNTATAALASKSTKASPDSFTAAGAGESMGPYGLKRVDYSKGVPKWPLPPHPPPRANPVRRYFGSALAACFGLFGVYVYFNQDGDIYEYWNRVDHGDVPIGDDNDDYEYDDDDEDDLEDFDEDQDEWAEDTNKSFTKG